MPTGKDDLFIEHVFDGIGMPKDAVLVVHSAIRGLGAQGYRAEGLIEAMLEYLSSGTLLMPTMSWRTVTPENPVFDEIETPSHVGVLSEIFRTRYAAARSLHPTHSVAGVGPAASRLLAMHHIGNTPVPATSPYGLMRDYPSYVLLLGVGLEMCTAIHHPEEVIAPEIYVKPVTAAEPYTLRDRTGKEIRYLLRRHPRLNRNFLQFGPILAAKGQILTGKEAGVPWSVFRLSDLLREVFALLIARPDAIVAG